MQKILVLSSWFSGSSAVVDYLERVGGHICRPLTENDGSWSFNPYESADFRAMVMSSIDEATLERRLDRDVFLEVFQDWLEVEEAKAEKDGSEFLVLHHPMAIFLLGEILSIPNVIPLVVTRPLRAIEKFREESDWHSHCNEPGAWKIYRRIYDALHGYTISYFTISYRDFANSQKSRWLMLDYCGIDISNEKEKYAFGKTTLLPLPDLSPTVS